MRIRKATMKDLREIKAISKKHNFEPKRDWKGLISSKDSEMFVSVDKKRIVGFTGLIYHQWNNTVQVSNIFVDPSHRKQGLALEMVNFSNAL